MAPTVLRYPPCERDQHRWNPVEREGYYQSVCSACGYTFGQVQEYKAQHPDYAGPPLPYYDPVTDTWHYQVDP